MITNGFYYISALLFITAILIYLPKLFRGKAAETFFRLVPPVVLIYLGLMLLCSARVWSLTDTAPAYNALKNPLLYAMLFIMLLRCDMRKILRLGPKMLIGFFAAAVSIGTGFIASYALTKDILGADAWKSLGALCGSWMGGGGNMLAVQAALDVDEGEMAYALVTDSVCATVYIIFLLWAIGFAELFNKWTRADTAVIDAVGRSLAVHASESKKPVTWQNIMLLTGTGFGAAAICTAAGERLNLYMPVFDKTTWTVLTVTLLGTLLAMTPLGRIKGTEELSNVLLYAVIALIASRADLSSAGNAHLWIMAGFIILAVHIVIMIIFAKLFKLDIFTCAVASLANIGGTATAPILAGTYNSSLVPVGIIMALLGYVIGTGGGLLVAGIMGAM